MNIADEITGRTKLPHALKAAILRDLGRNAFNRKSPQLVRVGEFFDLSAAEFRQAGMTAEVNQVLAEKQTLAMKAAGNTADQGARALIA